MKISEKYLYSYIRSCERILKEYEYHEPFARFITRFYKENKQMGSRDRKIVSRFCYNYFRIGFLASDLPFLERLVLAEYLCEESSTLVEVENPTLATSITKTTFEKLQIIVDKLELTIESIFPDYDHLSIGIDRIAFLSQQLVQPDLYLRVQRKHVKTVCQFLDKEKILYQLIEPNTLVLANQTQVNRYKKIEGMFEVQDLSSQRTIDLFPILQSNEVWWDACAGAGGKALMILDKYPTTQMLLSDVRHTILKNLNQRFTLAEIESPYSLQVIDLSTSNANLIGKFSFDGIIVDVPCSGSGTWSRTPEMKLQWNSEDIEKYTSLQKSIVTNAVPYLKQQGYLMYITCSVFRQENEEIVEFIQTDLGLKLEDKEILKGYENNADTLFVARFVKKIN